GPAFLLGKVIGAEGASFQGMSIFVKRPAKGDDLQLQREVAFSRDRWDFPVNEDGTFRAGPVPAEPSNVILRMPPIAVPMGAHGTMNSPGMGLDLGMVTLA